MARRATGPSATAARGRSVLWLGLLLALLPGAADTRESDRRQPASIEADRAEIDQPAGTSRYYGDVVFTQGTLRITGATVVVHAPAGAVRAAEAEGTPARIRQETDAGRLVRAHGRRIEYDAEAPRITLTGDAELIREGERFAAGRIRYWPDSGRVEAGRGEDGDRVQIRIEPQQDGGDE